MTDRPDYQDSTITTARFIKETKLSVTATASTHTLQDETKAVEVYNGGSSPRTVYMSIESTATTNSREIRPFNSRAIDIDSASLSFVCASGQTSTVWVTELG